MKKHKFRLEGYLRLKEFKEQMAKIELGQINAAIGEIDKKIAKLMDDIAIGYESQEHVAQSGADGKMLQFYPYYIEGIKSHIDALENQKYAFKKKYQVKLHELNVARGEHKVAQKLKEKDYQQYKKKQQKKENEKIEDLVQNWSVNIKD